MDSKKIVYSPVFRPDSVARMLSVPKQELLTPEWQERLTRLWQMVKEECRTEYYVFYEAENRCCIYINLGNAVHQRMDRLYAAGDYSDWMAVNALTDDLLFQISKAGVARLNQESRSRGFAVAAKLEVPDQLSLEEQKRLIEKLTGLFPVSAEVTSGGMLVPLKSMLLVFQLCKSSGTGAGDFRFCSSCPAVECQFRNVDNVIEDK